MWQERGGEGKQTLSIFWHADQPSPQSGIPRPCTSLLHLDHFTLPPTVKQKEVLSRRKLLLLPSNTDRMTTFPSPSSLSEFKCSKMVRISSNRKAAGFCRKSLSTLDYTEWFEETLVLGFLFMLHHTGSALGQQPRQECDPLCYWDTAERKSLKCRSFLLNALVCLRLNLNDKNVLTFTTIGYLELLFQHDMLILV